MNEGIVKWFNKKKNYGFIEYDEDAEIFFNLNFCNIKVKAIQKISGVKRAWRSFR